MIARTDRRAYLAIVAAGTCVALLLAARLNPWLDEGYSIATTSGGLAAALHRAIVFEWQAPLYFLVLDAWRQLGSGVFAGRLLSVLCYVALLALVPALVRRYAPGVPVAGVAAVVAVAPFALAMAVELRGYALAMLLSAALLICSYDAFIEPRRPLAATIATVACAAAIAYTHYFAAAVVAGVAVTVALYVRPERRRSALLAALAGALAALPLAILVRAQLGIVEQSMRPLRATDLVDVARTTLTFAVGAGSGTAMRLAVLALLVLGGVAVARARRGGLPPIVVTFAASSLALVALIALSGRHPELPRYACGVFVPAILAPFALAMRLPRRREIAWAWALGVVVLSLWVDVRETARMAKPGDWYRIGAYMRASGSDDLPLAVYPPGHALAARAALGDGRVVPIPAPLDPDAPLLPDPALRVRDVEAELRKASPGGRLWLAQSDPCSKPGCPALERAVADAYQVEASKRFYGETLLRIRRKSPERRIP